MLKTTFFAINTNGPISSFSHRGLWVFALTCQWFFSLMCQHGMKHEGLWRPSYFGFTFILQAKNVDGIVTNTCGLYFEACYYCKWGFSKSKCSFRCSSHSPYLICSLQFRGFEYLICSCCPCGLHWFVVSFFCLDLAPSFLYCSPFFGVFCWRLASFHQ
jgi:hypothetical protein